MKALIFPKHDFPHPSDSEEDIAKRKATVLEDLYLSLRVADQYITGRAPMNALTAVLDKVEPHFTGKLDGISIDAHLKRRDEDLEIHLEESEFEVVKRCTTLVCEEGFNAGTGATKQIGRIFDARRATRVLAFLDACKAPVVVAKPAETEG